MNGPWVETMGTFATSPEKTYVGSTEKWNRKRDEIQTKRNQI